MSYTGVLGNGKIKKCDVQNILFIHFDKSQLHLSENYPSVYNVVGDDSDECFE